MEALRAAGDRRAQAMQEARLGPDARDLILRARAEDVPVTVIADALRVSRQAIYDVLRDGAAG